jgi:D-amino-acid dehydrogenase
VRLCSLWASAGAHGGYAGKNARSYARTYTWEHAQAHAWDHFIGYALATHWPRIGLLLSERSMHVVILGAGLIGVTSAWYLRQAGHAVTVVDRQPAAAMETSFANGGQISVSHAEPWAAPGAPLQIFKWLGKKDAPLYFRPRLSLSQWRWGLGFLAQCTQARFDANCKSLLELGLESRAALQDLRRETGIAYEVQTRGILHYFTQQDEFEHAKLHAAKYCERGLDTVVKSAEEVLELEPAFKHSPVKLVGGTYTASDESGDAHLFTQRLAAMCAEAGVRFQYGALAVGLARRDARVTGAKLADGRLVEGDAVLVCMGAYSPLITAQVGVSMPVYPLKGYSITARITDASKANTASLTDETMKMVFTRLGDRIRVAGTAELNNYGLEVDDVRSTALVERAKAMFPEAADWQNATRWAGLRPATPTNNPITGPSKVEGLWLNTGHGTLGWTLACGSAKRLVAAMARA